MKYKILILTILFSLLGGFVFAQELAINYQFNVSKPDSANFISFKGPIRFISIEKDSLDTTTGASKFKTTSFFSPYLMDIQGKSIFSNGLRGVLLFPVAPLDYRTGDNFTVNKASNGVITIQYVHRGTAYKITTDKNGKIGFPKGDFLMRNIGYIQGAGPQVLSKDFSSDSTAKTVNWNKVWDTGVASGKEIAPGVTTKTGAVINDNGDPMAMYNWDGTLQVTFDNNILKISGSLKPVKR